MKRKQKIKVYTTPVIAGTFKGKKLEIPASDTTRSSKAILRESFFNTVQFDIVGKNFVEVFAGSGSVGLEALSRGAGMCYFIERDPVAYRCLQNNIAMLDPSRCRSYMGDSFSLFSQVYERLRQSSERSYFYFDPPFAIREGMDDIYDKTLALIETIEPEICETVAIEHMTGLSLPDTIGRLARSKSRKFGKSSLTYYHPKEEV